MAAGLKLGEAGGVPEERVPQKKEPGRSPSPPAARPAAPNVPSVRPTPPRGPVPLRPLPAKGVSPRPPPVVPTPAVPEPIESAPGPGATTEVNAPMPHIAIEAALADLVAWRREAEKKIVHLEAELAHLRRISSPVQPTLDLSLMSESEPPSAPFPVIHPLAAEIAPAPTVPVTALHLVSAARPAPRQQFDLEMRPGEYFDLPTGLDGERRKRMIAWFVVLVIVAGMAGLVISALASQNQHS